MRLHILKIEGNYHMDVLLGKKTFEIRFNDRGYKVGDLVQFKTKKSEDKDEINYNLWPNVYQITYITDYKQLDNFVVFAIKRVEEAQ